MNEKSRSVGAITGAVELGAFAAAVGSCCALPWAALRRSAFAHLDSRAFAQRVRDLLARTPRDGSGQALAARARP